jgi:pimeloyl-ACP methyl ester carboxylesterase
MKTASVIKEWVTVKGRKLECCSWGGLPCEKPAIVLLHEGLGSTDHWKNFPEKLAQATGYCVFAYSRAGYGHSEPNYRLPWPLDYMTREAIEELPAVLDVIGFKRGILIGHSDGASIAAIYAGSIKDFRIRGLCLISPHFFTEPSGLAAIEETKAQFESGGLKDRLAKYHADPDIVFRGWSGAWLDPAFKSWSIEDAIPYFRIPVLSIQGLEDQYGTLAQIDALASGSYAPVETIMLRNCKHWPHLEASGPTLEAIGEFVARLDRMEAAQAAVS